jgi:predicted nuclease of restriction endonuclease-like (RecB) superfamily
MKICESPSVVTRSGEIGESLHFVLKDKVRLLEETLFYVSIIIGNAVNFIMNLPKQLRQLQRKKDFQK